MAKDVELSYPQAITTPYFVDRSDAGRQLAASLMEFAGSGALVLGLANGGVPIAAAIAGRLGAEVGALAVIKLRHPRSSEYAIGAMTSDGEYVLNRGALIDLARADVNRVINAARDALSGQLEWRHRVAGRSVILVDDGIATGSTMVAGLRYLRRMQPTHLIAAAPVGPVRAIEDLLPEADQLVCPHQEENFHSVGRYYERFEHVTDQEVRLVLSTSPRNDR